MLFPNEPFTIVSTGEKELTDQGLNTLRGNAGKLETFLSWLTPWKEFLWVNRASERKIVRYIIIITHQQVHSVMGAVAAQVELPDRDSDISAAHLFATAQLDEGKFPKLCADDGQRCVAHQRLPPGEDAGRDMIKDGWWGKGKSGEQPSEVYEWKIRVLRGWKERRPGVDNG